MNLNDIHRGIEKHRKKKRVGRGKGSGLGKTSGHGHKGQGARAGFSALPVFEGGQMPLVRRVPKRGFHNRQALTIAVVNVDDLEREFESGAEVNLQSLRQAPCQGAVRSIEGARRWAVDQGIEGLGASLQPNGGGEDSPGGRRSDRAPGQSSGGEEQAESEETKVGRVERCGKNFASSLRSPNCVRRLR